MVSSKEPQKTDSLDKPVGKKAARQARAGDALRENLRKRKQQLKARQKDQDNAAKEP